MSRSTVMDPFNNIDAATVPAKQEDILLQRVKTEYYLETIQWFLDAIEKIGKPNRVLEIGCGTGHILDACCQRFCLDKKHMFGVDRSSFVIQGARQRFPAYTFAVADGNTVGFPDASFDLVFAATVLVHVDTPAAIVKEMARLVAPDGIVALLDQDFETSVLYPGDKALTRRVLTAATDVWCDGWIGRKLPSLLSHAGLDVRHVGSHVRVDTRFDKMFFSRIRDWIVAAGFSPHEASAWYDFLCCHATDGEFLFSRNFYTAIGVKK